MGKVGDIAIIGGVGVAALVGLFAVQGLLKSGVDLNPVDWGKNLGSWLQGLFGGSSNSTNNATNSDGSSMQSDYSYGYFPDGTRYVINKRTGIQTPSDSEWIAAHPTSNQIINRNDTSNSGTSLNHVVVDNTSPSQNAVMNTGVAGNTFVFNSNSGGVHTITVPSTQTTTKPPDNPTYGQVIASGYKSVSEWRAHTGG
jgi:hypothetical protein